MLFDCTIFGRVCGISFCMVTVATLFVGCVSLIYPPALQVEGPEYWLIVVVRRLGRWIRNIRWSDWSIVWLALELDVDERFA